jgi:hypothetical protein
MPKFLTHCKRGHEFSPENTHLKKDKKSLTGFARECRICKKGWYLRTRNTSSFKKRMRDASQRYREKFAEKHRIRARVNDAIRYGKMTKPSSCSNCGTKKARIEGHHEDYSKPLEVIWLCKKCHYEADKALKSKL